MNSLLAIAFTIGPITVRWYGIIIASAMALGIFLAYREVKRQHQNADHLLNILLLLIPAAIIGARLYYVIFRWSYYALNPAKIFAIWDGGLAIHGGVIAGILVLIIYAKVKKLDFLRWADILVPSLILGQAIGRWGNYINKEAYGPIIEDGSFWSWMPFQVYADGAYHHPTFLYESVWNLLIFVFLLLLLRRPHRVGSAFAGYLILYSVGRFFIEALRQDSLLIGGLRTAQVVSIICIAVGLVILYFIKNQPKIDVAAPLPLEKAKQYNKPEKQRKQKKINKKEQ